jgi:DNA-binding NarL/FixJ family response regulator
MTDEQQANMMTPTHKSWPVRVVLVSYNHLTRAGFQGIRQNTTEIKLIGESNGGVHAYALIQEMTPGCVIIDLESDTSSLESVKFYKQLLSRPSNSA